MGNLIELLEGDIGALNDLQLTLLLRNLLYQETREAHLPASSSFVSIAIDVRDGGEDGHVKWQGAPVRTDFLPSNNVLFQCKATHMSPSAAGREILKKDGTLKPKVSEVFEADGDYVLFYRGKLNDSQIQERIESIRKELRKLEKKYADTAKIHIYDANKINGWSRKFPGITLEVHRWLGRSRPEGIKSWNEWEGYEGNSVEYVLDLELKSHIDGLRAALIKTQASVRIMGQSGLGKTRLALEALRPPASGILPVQADQAILSNDVVFIDAADGSDRLVNLLSSWRREKVKCLLVVDNCDADLHRRLEKEVRHRESLVSLLTLDYDVDKEGFDRSIVIERRSDETIISILRQTHPDLSDVDLRRIAEFAQGYPQMAVLLGKARLSDEPNLGRLNDSELTNRLLWGREKEDKEALEVIRACALFDYVGFYENVAEHRRFVAETICGLDPEKFFGIASSFIKRRVLERRGRFVSVLPKPLALRLAAEWWDQCSPERAEKLLSHGFPEKLRESLCQQISKLDFLPRAKELTEKLCGVQGPFGNAEVLTSEWGSRLFRALVEVNPEATADCASRELGRLDKQALASIQGETRRNLVWALERLAFWESTFHQAASLLLALGSAENETWANNASNQFSHLYSLYLSGTQAPPNQRLAVIDRALSSSEQSVIELALKALGKGLEAFHFSRTGGVEQQGSRPPHSDWEPKSKNEIREYWGEILKRLIIMASKKGCNADLARQHIASRVRSLALMGMVETLDEATTQIYGTAGGYWPEALREIQFALEHDKKLSQTAQEQLKSLEMRITPKSLRERLQHLVGRPSFYLKDGQRAEYDQKLDGLIDECIKLGNSWHEFLPDLLQGSQRYTFQLGTRLFAKLPDIRTTIQAILEKLKEIETEKQNASLLAGILNKAHEVQRDVVDETLNKIAQNEKLRGLLPSLSSSFPVTEKDLERIWSLVDQGLLKPSVFLEFRYGRALAHLPGSTIADLSRRLCTVGVEGARTSLEILFLNAHRRPEVWEAQKEQFIEVLMTRGLIKELGSLELNNWKETAIGLLQVPERNPELARHLISEFLEAPPGFQVSISSEDDLQSVLGLLFKDYLQDIWPIVEGPLSSDDEKTSRALTLMFERNTFEGGLGGVLSDLPTDFLKGWCKRFPKTAPRILARSAPLWGSANGWSPLVMFLLDNYVTEETLRELTLRIYSFGWSGSAVAHIEMRLKAFEAITLHSNEGVRKWAIENQVVCKERIRQEKMRDEERDTGINPF